ncbi:unnamed protein product, partial [Urochloa humidicola]
TRGYSPPRLPVRQSTHSYPLLRPPPNPHPPAAARHPPARGEMASKARKAASPFASGPWGAFAFSETSSPARLRLNKLFAGARSGRDAGKGRLFLVVLGGLASLGAVGVGYLEYERLSYKNDVLAVKNAALQREIAATQREIAATRSRWIQWPTTSTEGPRTGRFFYHR